MWKDKPGRPERSEVTGLLDHDFSAVIRKIAGVRAGGQQPVVVFEDGESPPRLGTRKKVNRRTSKKSTVRAVYVRREWVRARMEEEFMYWKQFHEWLHGTDPKGSPGECV